MSDPSRFYGGAVIRGVTPDGHLVEVMVSQDGALYVTNESPAAAAGAETYHHVATAGTNAAVVSDRPARLVSLSASNGTTQTVYVKLYDLARVPDPATDTPRRTLGLPSGSSQGYALVVPARFPTGIAIALTRNIGDQDATPIGNGEAVVDVTYW